MSTLGPRTALKSRKISGSLAYILAQTNVKQGTKAATNDVAGCTLEMGPDGLWTGNLGTLTQAQADALVAAGAMATVKTGTSATVNGQQVTWGGVDVGWVAVDVFATRGVWAIGDSHTAGTAFGGGMTYDQTVYSSPLQGGLQFSGGSWLPFALFASEAKWTLRGFGATGGWSSKTILDYWVPLLLAVAAPGDIVVVHAGTNNQSSTDTQEIHRVLRGAGLVTIGILTPPNTGGTLSSLFAFNAKMEAYFRSNGIQYVDLFALAADVATGLWKAAYYGDGIHGNLNWNQASGQAIAAKINALCPDSGGLIQYNAGTTGQFQTNPLAQNALTLGVDWQSLSAIGTSTVAQAAFAYARGGQSYEFTRNDTNILARLSAVTLVPGHRYRFGMSLAVSGGSPQWQVRIQNFTNAKYLLGYGYQTSFAILPGNSRFFSEFVAPAGLSDNVFQPVVTMGGASGSKMNLSEITFMDLTALGLD